ncbi:MAG TPA: OmpH family outer membrane protein [Blastocatellia bacterium]|nr:OmpH family outer membrane protein [Blastocatellia bacterium]
MRVMRLFAFSAVVGTCVAASALAQQPAGGNIPDGKVAVINTQVFPERIGELKQKYEQVNNQYQDRYKKLQDLDKQVNDLTNELATKVSTLSPEKQQEMKDNLENMKRRGQREAEDFQAEYNKALEGTTKPVRDKLAQFIQGYSSQRGVTMIIRLAEAYQAGILAFSSTSVDLTDDFINEYNKANPVPGGAPATQQRPAGSTTAQPTKPGGKP